MNYSDNGKTLDWGKDISEENMELLNDGEIFTLLKYDGEPHSLILKDSYGVIREMGVK